MPHHRLQASTRHADAALVPASARHQAVISANPAVLQCWAQRAAARCPCCCAEARAGTRGGDVASAERLRVSCTARYSVMACTSGSVSISPCTSGCTSTPQRARKLCELSLDSGHKPEVLNGSRPQLIDDLARELDRFRQRSAHSRQSLAVLGFARRPRAQQPVALQFGRRERRHEGVVQFTRQLHALLVPQAIESMKQIGQLLRALERSVWSCPRFVLPVGSSFCVMSVSSSSRDGGAR